jgi:hypothetical protein
MTLPPLHLWTVSADLVPLRGGHRNRAFRTTGLSADLVFKTTRRAPAALDWLTPVHRLAEEAGFIVPLLRSSVNGRLTEAGWTCEPFIPGPAFAAGDLPLIRPALARFHALARDLPQRPGFLSSQQLLHRDSGGDVDLADMPAGLAQTCRAAWRALDGQAFSIVHGDLNPGNLLHCPDGRPALLDWDECRRDITLFDTGQLGPVTAVEQQALLAWEVACSWKIEPDHARKIAARLG